MSASTDKTTAGQHDYLVDYVQHCWKEADEAMTDRLDQWRELWRCYQNRQDYSSKLPWQSKLVLPKVWVKVERASAEVRRAMLQTEKLFKLRPNDSRTQGLLGRLELRAAVTDDPNELGTIRARIQRIRQRSKLRTMRAELDERRFRMDLAETNLSVVYGEVAKVAFLLGLAVPKVGWDYQAGQAVFNSVDPFNIRISPDWMWTQDGPPEYVIERKVVRMSRLREMAERSNAEYGDTYFNLGILDQIGNDYASTESADEDARRGLSAHVRESGRVECLLLWGDIPKPDHMGYHRYRRLLTILNRRYVFRDRPNPFEHGRPPYVPTMPLTYPFRGQFGTSLVEPVVPMQYAMNNALNLFVDGLNFTVNKQFQADVTQLLDPRQLYSVYPGKIWQVKPNQNVAPVLREIPMGQMGMDAIRVIEMLSRDMQEATGVTEFLQGLPGRQAKTLGEIEIKTMESRGMFDIVAKEMEHYSLRPLLEMTYDLYSQFKGYPSRRGRYQIAVGGMSLHVAQQQLMESIVMLLGMALKYPPLAQRTDVDGLWQRLLSVHNLSDCYERAESQSSVALTPEQQAQLRAKAERDAAQVVGQMGPEQMQEFGALMEGQS